MFGGGPGPWGDEPPFGVPVFVVTHHARAPTRLFDGGAGVGIGLEPAGFEATPEVTHLKYRVRK